MSTKAKIKDYLGVDRRHPLAIVAVYALTLLLAYWFGMFVTSKAAAATDTVQGAYEGGTLELLSIMIGIVGVSLTVLAVVVAVSAVAGFWMIRSAALEAARTEARAWMDKEAPRLLQEFTRLGALSQGDSSPDIKLKPGEEGEVLAQATELPEEEVKK